MDILYGTIYAVMCSNFGFMGDWGGGGCLYFFPTYISLVLPVVKCLLFILSLVLSGYIRITQEYCNINTK